jgi:predicted outer membrane protein
MKDALTSIYFELQLARKVRTAKGKGSEPVKKIGVKLYADLNKAWGDFATVAQARGEKVPDELSGSDKSAIERLTKLDAEAFDKEFLQLVGKESKKLVRDFEAGAKSIQDPEVKAAAEKWTPALKEHAQQIDAAAAAVK